MAVTYYLADLRGRGRARLGLAAWLAPAASCCCPPRSRAVLLGFFSLELGWRSTAAPATPSTSASFLRAPAACGSRSSCRPRLRRRPVHGAVFAAVQAWAGADQPRPRRRRASTCSTPPSWWSARSAVAVLQSSALGFAGAVRADRHCQSGRSRSVIGRTMPTKPLSDLLSIVFRAFYRLEVTGLENFEKAGPNGIVALNHVSFLDAPLALSLLEASRCSPSTRHRQAWWVKPFLRFARTMRSIPQAAGDARPDQGGAQRRFAGDLSRGPHHRHRQPDEGL